jgi:NADPH-dependent 2,4-dienoyl-CoA reductase/sulfur reductase-like enzyme/rhodanese-related sulfurtransferase
MATKIIVVGGVAAGPKAAAKARRCDAEAEITIIEKDEYISYGACGFPYFVEGLVEEVEELMKTPVGVKRDAKFFDKVKGINVFSQTEVLNIYKDKKEVELKNLKNGENYRLPYDKLVLATGSTPLVPPINGIDLENIYRLKRPSDAIFIDRFIKDNPFCDVVIVGAGMIGMEMAESLIKRGSKVTIVEMLNQVVPGPLDSDIALLLENYLKQKGVEVLTGHKVTGFEGERKVRKVITEKREISADMVILSIGVRPNIDLAQSAGLKLGESGAIEVNQYLNTSDPDIFAAGDCAEVTHIVSGKKIFLPLGSTANRQGRVAGINVTGGKEIFPGVLGTSIFKAFDYNVGRTGLSEKEALSLGYNVETIICPGPDKSHFYPTANPIMLKLIAEKESHKILGAQGIGPGDVAKRIDVLASALMFKAKVEDLSYLDLAYAPPFSSPLDNINISANILGNKIKGIVSFLTPKDVKKKMEKKEDFIFLDVRAPFEFEEIKLPNSINIPLGMLREKTGELPKDKEIITFCKISLRGYEAALILASYGFTNIKVMEGGIFAWPYEKGE